MWYAKLILAVSGNFVLMFSPLHLCDLFFCICLCHLHTTHPFAKLNLAHISGSARLCPFFAWWKKIHRTYCIVLKSQNDINKTLESKHVANLLIFNDCIWNWQWLLGIKLKPYIFKWFKEHQLPTKVLKWNQIACSQ